MAETEWRVLYRGVAVPVYEGWKEIERQIAAKKGIVIPDISTKEKKISTEACAAFSAIYECMWQHFQQMTDEEWKNL